MIDTKKAVALMVVLLAAAPLMAMQVEEKPTTKPVEKPSAATLIAKHVEAMGGAKMLAGIKSQKMTALFSMGEMLQDAPLVLRGKMVERTVGEGDEAKKVSVWVYRLDIDFGEGLGVHSEGSDGRYFYESSAMSGTRLLDEEEAAAKRLANDFTALSNWREHFSKAVVLDKKKIGEQEAWGVELTPKVGHPRTHWFDTETYREIRHDEVADSPMGKMSTETYQSDFKKIEPGLVLPTKSKTVISGIGEQIVEFDSIILNGEVDDAELKIPEEVAKLIAKREKEAEEASDEEGKTEDQTEEM